MSTKCVYGGGGGGGGGGDAYPRKEIGPQNSNYTSPMVVWPKRPKPSEMLNHKRQPPK